MATKIAVIVGSEQKGLYISIGRQLMESYSVLFLAENRDAGTVISRLCHPQCPMIEVIPDPGLIHSPTTDTVSDAVKREKMYGITYSEIMSMDRGLGRGYMQNVDGYPWIKRADWGHHEKLECLNVQFQFFEKCLSGVTLLISQFPKIVPITVCNYRSIKHFHLLQARYGERMVWSDGDRFLSSTYIEGVENHLEQSQTDPSGEFPLSQKYEHDAIGNELMVRALERVTIRSLVSDMVLTAYHTLLVLSLGRGKRNSYVRFTWLVVILKRYIHYHYILNKSVKPDAYKDDEVVYFPLHMEPEITLLQFCSEFNNVFEAIVWLSKALPSNKTLVIKENAKAFGHRTKFFYKKIRAMGNVVFSSPEISSEQWIQKSNFVVTIAGTVGEEAVSYCKPVIVFGYVQAVNYLPSVFLVKKYEDVRMAVEKIISGSVSQTDLETSRAALSAVVLEHSFVLSGYVKQYNSSSLDEERGSIAITQLNKAYPNCLPT